MADIFMREWGILATPKQLMIIAMTVGVKDRPLYSCSHLKFLSLYVGVSKIYRSVEITGIYIKLAYKILDITLL